MEMQIFAKLFCLSILLIVRCIWLKLQFLIFTHSVEKPANRNCTLSRFRNAALFWIKYLKSSQGHTATDCHHSNTILLILWTINCRLSSDWIFHRLCFCTSACALYDPCRAEADVLLSEPWPGTRCSVHSSTMWSTHPGRVQTAGAPPPQRQWLLAACWAAWRAAELPALHSLPAWVTGRRPLRSACSSRRKGHRMKITPAPSSFHNAVQTRRVCMGIDTAAQ